eukprot:TRINITY_DN989_c1_g1_i7.p1 TRINITY_DN989_c1_g1~~TRINITY_DN989_c1_g1_i7.p1  ORF type:complete len:108 (-),score=15.10 TRINITY_DN989_c1_g1_i7:69-392(-)
MLSSPGGGFCSSAPKAESRKGWKKSLPMTVSFVDASEPNESESLLSALPMLSPPQLDKGGSDYIPCHSGSRMPSSTMSMACTGLGRHCCRVVAIEATQDAWSKLSHA